MQPLKSNKDNGFTIIEMLISVTLLAMLVTAVAFAFDASVKNYQANQGIYRTVNTARAALLRITNEVRIADIKRFAGEVNFSVERKARVLALLDNGHTVQFTSNADIGLTVNGERIVDRLYRIFRETFAEIIVVTNDPIKYLDLDANIVTDLFPVRSSLTGIHDGLFHCRTPYAFFAWCDIPYLKKEVVETGTAIYFLPLSSYLRFWS